MADALRDYQIEDLGFLMKRKRGLLLHDPGGGKTPPACLFMYWVWKEHQGVSLWAMPTHLMAKNRDELLRFSNFKPEDVVIIRGSFSAARKEKLRKSGAKVFILSFQGLVGQRSGVPEWSKYSNVKCIVIDEMHKAFSNAESPSSASLMNAMRNTPLFCGMTGTIIKGRLNSAYVAMHICEPRFYGSYYDFMNQHSIRDFFGTVIGWKNHEKVAKILGQISRRKTFDEIYGAQEIVFFIEHVEMAPSQKTAYDEYAAMGMLELDSMILSGANEGVNLLRLRQILAHPERISVPVEKDDSGKVLRTETVCLTDETTARDEKLKDHLEEHLSSGEPLLILSSLVPEQERVLKMCRDLGLSVELINSDTLQTKRVKIDHAFKNGTLKVVVGSPKTMATGFNWPHLNHVLFLSLDYDHDDFIQAYRRAVRGKRTRPLRVTLIQYRDSVEQKQDDILDRKSRESNAVDSTYEILNLSMEHRKGSKNVQSD
jgi:superfamily II DNA or RNA helicase